MGRKKVTVSRAHVLMVLASCVALTNESFPEISKSIRRVSEIEGSMAIKYKASAKIKVRLFFNKIGKLKLIDSKSTIINFCIKCLDLLIEDVDGSVRIERFKEVRELVESQLSNIDLTECDDSHRLIELLK